MRLADDVVIGRDQRAWGLGPDGTADTEGAAVAVGPAAADPLDALAELARLVKAGGALAAGAGVDLPGGFRSARLEGARGDRRDAVLAALRVLGLESMGRIGDRAGVLVALYGGAATKKVAAAAGAAIAEGRWAVVHLASAASDLLGREQLEIILRLPAEPGIDGLPSDLADHLGRVLSPYPRKRRLDLLLDLWERVRAHHAALRRRERLLGSQARNDRLGSKRRRYRENEDEIVLSAANSDLGTGASRAELARWSPPAWYWPACLNRALLDAITATVLLRTAVAVSDHGAADGLARCRDQIAAAATMIGDRASGRAPGLPPRPGTYVRDLQRTLDRGASLDSGRTEAYIHQRLARARDYGLVVMEAVTSLLWTLADEPDQASDAVRNWAASGLPDWRRTAGYTGVRPPAAWEQPVLFGSPDEMRPLAEREEEVVGDLLWYAELGDALAEIHGHDAASVEHGPLIPDITWDPDTELEPLRPGVESIQLAAAGAAQLISLGGEVPARSRTWNELVDGLMAGTAIAEALTGEFTLAAPLAAVDGTAIPGTRARVEWARSPRQLAEWSKYMGNCIASQWYIDDAISGKCGLAALTGSDGRILANLEVRPARGWRVAELLARYNTAPDPKLEKRVRAWVARLPAPESIAPTVHVPRPHRVRRTRRTPTLFQEVAEPLNRLAERAMASGRAVEAVTVLSVLAPGDPGDSRAALTALRRVPAERLTAACRDRLQDAGLSALWRATGVRPLAETLAELDPVPTARSDQLVRLTEDAPLPRSLRKLARAPGVAPARSMELVGRRIRAALGRLVRSADPVITAAVSRADRAALCPLVIATTCWGGPGLTPVPDVPGIDADDGPWRRAIPGARELGTDPAGFLDQDGLLVPTAWLGNGGWQALWNRAGRQR